MPFKGFLCTLQSSISDLHAALVEMNITQLSDDLLELNLVELDKEVKLINFYLKKHETSVTNESDKCLFNFGPVRVGNYLQVGPYYFSSIFSK